MSSGSERPGLEPTLPPSIATSPTLGSVDPAIDATIDSGGPPRVSTGLQLEVVDRARYEHGRELARGGMGRIRIARDRRLDREVAIKELLYDTPDARGRFEREVRITAKLQHPTIVNVLEAGQWNTGEPFYVMKLVVGESLDRVVQRRTTLEARLGLVANVIAVVEALAFAHSRKIIHRDLKPANVLVGEFGETVVIDWGLAKSLDESDIGEGAASGIESGTVSGTVAGAVIGTPSYMAPEQAEGTSLDARADVYALGAMLYHVLAGVPPYTGKTTNEILDNVLAGPPRPLHDRDPDIPVDLVAIVDKSLARKPEDRYPSANELAADLTRFQTGQLVGSHRYTLGELVRRWLRRHRVALTVAAVMFAALAVAVVVGVTNVVGARRHADEQRSLAETNARGAEDLMGFMLVDLRQRLALLGKVDLLDTVAQKAVDYYRHRPEATSDDELGHRAMVLTDVAQIIRARGHVDAALAQAREALAIRETVALHDPGAAQLELALAHADVGELVMAAGDDKGASADLQIALAIAKPHGAEPRWQYALGRIQMLTGESLLHRNVADAIAAFRAGLTVAESLANGPSSTFDAQRLVSTLHTWLGDAITAQGDGARAIAEYRAAVTSAVQLAARDPDNKVAVEDVATFRENLGGAFEHQGNIDQALAEYRDALELDMHRSREDPTNASLRTAVATGHSTVGTLLLRLGKTEAGMAELRTALDMREQLADLDPSNRVWQRSVAVAYDRIGRAFKQQGKLADALDSQRRSAAIVEALRATDRNNATWARDAVANHAAIAEIHKAEGDLAGALAERRAALAITEQFATGDHATSDWQRDLYTSHVGIADLVADKDPSTAAAEYRAAFPIADRMLVRDPTNANLRRILGVGHTHLGRLLAARSDLDGALVEHRIARSIFETLVAQQPKDMTWQNDLLLCRRSIAEVLWTKHDIPAAATEYAAILALDEANAAADSADIDLQSMLASGLSDMGDVLDAEHEPVEALAKYSAALVILEKLVAKDPTNAAAAANVAATKRTIASCCKRE